MAPLPLADIELLGERLSAALGKDLVRIEVDLPLKALLGILNWILEAVSSKSVLAGGCIGDDGVQLRHVLTICGTRSMAS